MHKTVEFIVLAATFDTTRVERGLYHHPKLLNPLPLKKALKEEFNKVMTSIDPERDPVGYSVIVTLTGNDPATVTSELRQAFEKLKNVVMQTSGHTQQLNLATMSSDKYSLERDGVKVPVPFTILKQTP